MFRFGKPLDHLQTVLKSLAIEDDFVRLTTVLKSAGYGLWLVLDGLQWLNGAKVIDLDKDLLAFINKHAPRLWLLGIASSLALNLYKVQGNFEKRQVHLRQLLGRGSVSDIAGQFVALDKCDRVALSLALTPHFRESKKTVQAAVQDMIDLVIPLSLTGFLDVSPGMVGLAGTITSVLGAISIWPSSESKGKNA